VLDPNQGKTEFAYNSFGELETELDAGGDVIGYDMGSAGRVTKRYSVDSTATFTWDEDRIGLLYRHEVGGASKTFDYDTSDRLLSTTTVIGSDSYTVAHQYDDNFGRPVKLTYPNGLSIAYQYNNYGYLESESNAASGYLYRKVTAQDV